MTEQRLKELEHNVRMEIMPLQVQELIDEVRFLKAALADARKELDRTPDPDCVVNP